MSERARAYRAGNHRGAFSVERRFFHAVADVNRKAFNDRAVERALADRRSVLEFKRERLDAGNTESVIAERRYGLGIYHFERREYVGFVARRRILFKRDGSIRERVIADYDSAVFRKSYRFENFAVFKRVIADCKFGVFDREFLHVRSAERARSDRIHSAAYRERSEIRPYRREIISFSVLGRKDFSSVRNAVMVI